MRSPGLRWQLVAGLACLFFGALGGEALAADTGSLDNASCLGCHEKSKPPIELADADGEARTLRPVDPHRFDAGVHAGLQCLACHTEITDSQARHQKKAGAERPTCIGCHETLWKDAQASGVATDKPRLGVVVQNIEAYRNSFHARPSEDAPGQPMASCEDCHTSHDFNVPADVSQRRSAWHATVPETCGSACHEDQLESYAESAHGHKMLEEGDTKAAVCTDCHSAHAVLNTSSDTFKLATVNTCGGCHDDKLASYADTYHGQVNRLGYAYTAKCADCHGSHRILGVDHPKSTIHPNNRMKTCMQCHSDKKAGMRDATPGFASFAPHATTSDFDKYPQMYVASKFMVGLLIFVFAFFWAHSGLWYYREWKDRKQGKTLPHVDLAALGIDPSKHFRRFHWGWRLAHLLFALATMTLVLTGSTALFAESPWAPRVAEMVGGPKMLALIHRIAAAVFIAIFLGHFVHVMQKLLRDRRFRWFGPDSLLPNWKDFADCWGMFKWFFGKGPRPEFERWAYYEKFDYWAVFWGVNVIGWSGLMLAFPHVTATYLPGWVFNVATLVHGEEAFLAAVFLFTVHFFNNHFRPDKLPPPDVVMFTGTQSLDEFRHDHPAHFKRMVASGEIQKYLIDRPARPFHIGSVVLGLVLIGIGLGLLVLVGVGFFTG